VCAAFAHYAFSLKEQCRNYAALEPIISGEFFNGVKYFIFQTIQKNSYLILLAQPHAGPEDFWQGEKEH
jgi:hypothetical protein